MAIRHWSSTASGNASPPGINFAEGQAPSTLNNSNREVLAQIHAQYVPDQWAWCDVSSTASVASQSLVRVAGNHVTTFEAGRRVKLRGGSTTRYGTVISSSFTSETSITLTPDSGSLSASHSIIAVGPEANSLHNNAVLASRTTTFTAPVTFQASATFSATTRFSTAAEISATLSVGGITRLGSTLSVSGAARTLAGFDVSATASVGHLIVAGNSSFVGTTSFAGTAIFGATVTFSAAARALAGFDVSGTASVGTLIVGAGGVNAALRALSSVDVSATLSVAGQAKFGGTVSISGAARTLGPLDVSATVSAAALVLTAALPIAQGGTGATTSGSARSALGFGVGTLLATASATGSAITFSSIDQTFTTLVVVLTGIKGSVASSWVLQLSTDNSTFVSAGYSNALAGTSDINGGANASIFLVESTGSLTQTSAANIMLQHYSGAGSFPRVAHIGMNAGAATVQTGMGMLIASAIQALTIRVTTGIYSAGAASLYGIR